MNKCERLQSLDISGTNVCGDHIRTLTLVYLAKLNVRDTYVEEQDIEWLVQTLNVLRGNKNLPEGNLEIIL